MDSLTCSGVSKEAGAPLPCSCTPSPLSNLLIGNNSESTALISRHSGGAAAPAAPERYRRPGCPVAPGCGKVSAGAGCAFGFVFPPHRSMAAVGVSWREHRKVWRLLSTEFCLLPLLYKRISPKKKREGSSACSKSILSASILGLCLLRAIILGEGATVCWIEPRCAGLQTGLLSVGPQERLKYHLAFARDFSFPYENRVASECQPSLPVSSQLHHGIKLLIPFIPFWE